MNFSKSDLPHIQWSLLILLAVLGTGGAIIAASEGFVTRAQEGQRALKQQLSAARGQLATAQEDQEKMQTYTQEYNTLLQRDIIGDDRRLDWMEALDKMRKQSKASGLMDFNYSIAPQQLYAPFPPVDSGNFDLHSSGMSMQFNLLHEGQLLTVLDALRTNSKGWFMLDRCELERNSAHETNVAPNAQEDDEPPLNASTPVVRSFVPQLKAQCAGGWLTLKNRNDK